MVSQAVVVVAAGAVAALVLGDTVAWWYVTGRIEAGLPLFVRQAEAEGWRIDYASLTRTGWPLMAGVRLGDVRTARVLGGPSLRWTADRVLVRVSANDPAALHIDAEGDQAVDLGAGEAVMGRAGLASYRVPLSGGASSFEVRELETVGDHGLQIGHASGALAARAMVFAADAVHLRPLLAAPFDAALSLSARLTTTLPVPEQTTAAAAAWQAAGGTIGVSEVALAWGPLHVRGSASGGLDDALQPRGRGEFELQGAPEAIDAAARSGLIATSQASAARAVLQILSLAASGGPVRLPVVIEDRRLGVAGFPLLRVPSLNWGPR